MLLAENISVSFRRRDGSRFYALDDVTIKVAPGASVAIVGESGSGKTTLVRTICGFEKPECGTVTFDGVDVTGLSVRKRMNRAKRSMQLIFQDAVGALNPRMRVYDAIAEVLRVHSVCEVGMVACEVERLLRLVGLSSEFASRFPSALSGGQCQRVCIARALALKPSMLIGDEPVSALDVSVQARILGLLDALRRSEGLTLLIITHDLAVVSALCDYVYILEKGRVVEEGEPMAIFDAPQSPYTRRLLAAVPRI